MQDLKFVAGLQKAEQFFRFLEFRDGCEVAQVEIILSKQLVERVAASDLQVDHIEIRDRLGLRLNKCYELRCNFQRC